MSRAAVLAALVALAFPFTVLAQGDLPRASHRGVDLYAIAPDPERHFDVSIVPPEKGIESMRAALDLLLSRSYLSGNAIASLQKHGRVILVYDPNYPEKGQMLGYTVAGFFPKYFRERGDFLVRVGRHGIKWPARELAAVLAHELAGHGMQEARGERERMRPLDRECEAWLYEEQAYQDMGVDKSSKPMVEFRKQLEERECSDFRRYQAEAVPVSLRLWETRNPNVPSLLVVFRQYLKANGTESRVLGQRG
jgi:hypothetical protein